MFTANRNIFLYDAIATYQIVYATVYPCRAHLTGFAVMQAEIAASTATLSSSNCNINKKKVNPRGTV